MSEPSGVWSSLRGFRVLEVGQNIAGPYGANVLGYFGADVVKIEPLEGDSSRRVPPSVAEGVSAQFAVVNTNKRLVALNLKHPRARAVTDRLLAESDVFVQNLRPGRAAKFGLSPERVHEINPALIHCTVTAFYPRDELRPGYDVLVQAETGMMAITGETDRPPSRVPMPVLDYSTGLWTAMAVSAALHGQHDRVALRITLQDVALSLMHDSVTSYLAGDPPRQRRGSATEGMTPHGAYSTADGELVIAAGNDHLFARFATILGPPVGGDSHYDRLPGRLERRSELDDKINAVLATRGNREWIDVLDAAGVPVAVIRGFGEGVDRHVHLSSTGTRPVGTSSVLAPPVEVVGAPWDYRLEPGPIGRDTRQVLERVGFGQEELDDLENEGVIR